MDTLSDIQEKNQRYNERGDCTVRATAIICNTTYEDAWNICKMAGRNHRHGCHYIKNVKPILEKRGFKFILINNHSATVRTFQREVLFNHVYLLVVSGHVLAIKNGRVQDWTDGRCHRIQRAYRIVEQEGAYRNLNATIDLPKTKVNRPPKFKRVDKYNWELYNIETGEVYRKYKRKPKITKSHQIRGQRETLGKLAIRKIV